MQSVDCIRKISLKHHKPRSTQSRGGGGGKIFSGGGAKPHKMFTLRAIHTIIGLRAFFLFIYKFFFAPPPPTKFVATPLDF